MITAADIMRRAGRLLLDESHVRWPLAELAEWMNEAVRMICLAKPSAATKSIVFALDKGTLQHVPHESRANGDIPLSLTRLVRNIDNPERIADGGAIITIAGRSALDAQEPDWHNPKWVRFEKQVAHYIYDEANPLEFYVYPGNDGTGHVEAVIAYCPAPITANGDDKTPESWAQTLGLPEPYSTPILDYVLYRAQIKDDLAGNGGRASAHLQLFQSAIGIKIDTEAATSPNVERIQRQ